MAKKRSEEPIEDTSSTVPALRDNTIPDYLKDYASMGSVGFENVKREDMVMPRLAVAQGLSPQTKKHEGSYIPGLEEGDFFNTVSGEIYGTKVTLTPLFFFPSRIYFPPRGSNAPELCRATQLDENGNLHLGKITPKGCHFCPHSNFLDTPRADGSVSPDCTYFMNYICVIHKQDGLFEPIAFSLKSKMLKPAKLWNSKLRVKQAPGFVLVTNVETVPEKAPKGTFFNVKFNDVTFAHPTAVKQLEQLFTHWSNRPIEIDTRDANADEAIEVDEVSDNI